MAEEVELFLTGPVKRPPGVGVRTRVALPSVPATVSELLAAAGFSDEEIRHLRALVDGVPAALGSDLVGGERVTVFLPVGGG